MSFLGKVIIEGKKIVDTVTEKATPFVEEAVNTLKEETTAITAQAKRAIDMGVLKAEIDSLYKDLGKAVYENGLDIHNNEVIAAIHLLNEKSLQLEAYEKEIEDEEEAAKEAYINSLLKYEKETEEDSEIPVETVEDDKIETSKPSDSKSQVRKIEIEVIEPSKVENKVKKTEYKATSKTHNKKHTESGGKKSSGHKSNKKNNK